MFKELLGLEGMLRFSWEEYPLLVLSGVIYGYGGWPFLTGMIDELRQRLPGMMTLVGLALSVAFFYSAAVVFGLPGKTFFWEVATLVDVMLLGHWLEMRSVSAASGALNALARLLPNTAHRKTDSGIEDVPVDELRTGDRILVKPGEKIPADGEIEDGESSINESLVTGEAEPVSRGQGESVIGGSVNGEGAITVRVAQTGADSYLSQVMKLVQRAQESKSRSQDLANRAALWLTIVALAAGGLTLAVWVLLGREFVFSLERTVTVMVITCPHALGLAVPLVVAVSTAIGARRGILVRNRGPFERARKVQAILFDKTGTLTLGQFRVVAVAPAPGQDEAEILRLAGAVESGSEHPIARGVLATLEERGIEPYPMEDFLALKGKGARATVNGGEVLAVSRAWLEEEGLEVPREMERSLEPGKTRVYVVRSGKLLGGLALADKVRESSREAIERLRAMGVRPMMLTGDSEAAAAEVASELGLEDFFAEVRPDKKAEKVREVQSRGLVTAMVGDGINDAPALAQADVGMAIGAGANVAQEAADVVLVRNDPRQAVLVIELARKTYSKVVQNLLWATGYNVIAIPLAAGVLASRGIVLSPAVGALFMSLSTVIVAINARLLKLP